MIDSLFADFVEDVGDCMEKHFQMIFWPSLGRILFFEFNQLFETSEDRLGLELNLGVCFIGDSF